MGSLRFLQSGFDVKHKITNTRQRQHDKHNNKEEEQQQRETTGEEKLGGLGPQDTSFGSALDQLAQRQPIQTESAD